MTAHRVTLGVGLQGSCILLVHHLDHSVQRLAVTRCFPETSLFCTSGDSTVRRPA